MRDFSRGTFLRKTRLDNRIATNTKVNRSALDPSPRTDWHRVNRGGRRGREAGLDDIRAFAAISRKRTRLAANAWDTQGLVNDHRIFMNLTKQSDSGELTAFGRLCTGQTG